MISTVGHPDWSRQTNLREINVRQFTPEGTFAAFEAQLPRLRATGVGAAFKPFAVLAATLPGRPPIYGGQEAALDKRLAFFERDHRRIEPWGYRFVGG